MTIFTFHLMGNGWTKNSSEKKSVVWLKGQIYRDETTMDINCLYSELAARKRTEQLSSFLSQVNGFYTWVEQSDGQIRAAVDHIRSSPLFYGLVEGRFCLSDDAEWVRQQVGDQEMDSIAREEFQLAGYVTGPETVFPSVKQLQAGEFLVATEAEDGIRLETHRFYRFLHTEPHCYKEPALREELDSAAMVSVKRLIDYANGRQIVVPLSGGYDSRLIVTLLKRHGYENVLTFTYGVQGNKESEYSKLVADALGFRWHFVEYSYSLWREAWKNNEQWEYQKWASGWSSIAIFQDWLAVKILKDKYVINSDCLFVPGHTGDFISGGHIPAGANPSMPATQNDLSQAVLKKHYGLAPYHLVTKRSKSFWANRVHDRTDQLKVSDGVSLANASERWEWQERQAKFICNAVRVYEFFGYEWWMPLWDKDFILFWERVPLELRKGKKWYEKYVSTMFLEHSRFPSKKELRNASDDSKIFGACKLILSQNLSVKTTIKRLVKNFGLRFPNKILDPLCIQGRYPKFKYRKMIESGYETNGVNAHFLLDSIDKSLRY